LAGLDFLLDAMGRHSMTAVGGWTKTNDADCKWLLTDLKL
jgi:hypothetical protein